MSRDLQIRSDLQLSVQQHNNRAAGSLIARQLQAFTVSGTLDPNKDTALCDTSGGTITMLLPLGRDAIKGLPFFYYKTHASNTLTVARATGSGQTIEGSTSVSTTGVNTCIAVMWDGTVFRRLNASVAAGTGLLAANNLSDLAAAATARTNLGSTAVGDALFVAATALAARTTLAVNKVWVPIRATTIAGAGSPVYRVLAPCAGTVSLIRSIIEGALTTGNAVLTAAINGTPITTGVITIEQAASAAGDKDSCIPTAANTVAENDELSWTVTGAQDAAVAANGYFEITRT